MTLRAHIFWHWLIHTPHCSEPGLKIDICDIAKKKFKMNYLSRNDRNEQKTGNKSCDDKFWINRVIFARIAVEICG